MRFVHLLYKERGRGEGVERERKEGYGVWDGGEGGMRDRLGERGRVTKDGEERGERVADREGGRAMTEGFGRTKGMEEGMPSRSITHFIIPSSPPSRSRRSRP